MTQLIADAGSLPGIKVDGGAKDLAGHAGEMVTEGLDGLRERLSEYHGLGAIRQMACRHQYCRWPTIGCLPDGQHPCFGALCRFVPEAEIVPIVEPEVIMDGSHSVNVATK